LITTRKQRAEAERGKRTRTMKMEAQGTENEKRIVDLSSTKAAQAIPLRLLTCADGRPPVGFAGRLPRRGMARSEWFSTSIFSCAPWRRSCASWA
jgi:hypothetical protein